MIRSTLARNNSASGCVAKSRTPLGSGSFSAQTRPSRSRARAGANGVPALLLLLLFSGCAAIGVRNLNPPPEFNQKILLKVDDRYKQHQAPRSTYDIGDLQSFHSQHTLPAVIQEAFQEMFGQVEMVRGEPQIEAGAPDVPAVFEVRILDLSHDFFDPNMQTFRGEVTLAVAMKSPNGHIFWQKAFRGEGFVQVDQQFGAGLGPEQAVLDAMNDAIVQMQDAMLASPEVRLQLRHYRDIDAARRSSDV